MQIVKGGKRSYVRQEGNLGSFIMNGSGNHLLEFGFIILGFWYRMQWEKYGPTRAGSNKRVHGFIKDGLLSGVHCSSLSSDVLHKIMGAPYTV